MPLNINTLTETTNEKAESAIQNWQWLCSVRATPPVVLLIMCMILTAYKNEPWPCSCHLLCIEG
jgi:hypothetical protein